MLQQFSIIIPTYNRAASLKQAIKSVLSQTLSYFEVIVVDDGSTDNTSDIVKQFNDNRLKYFYKINEERAVARNFGIQKASGNYITFLDSDDLLFPDHLATASELISQYHEPEWFHLGYEVGDDQKILWKVNKRIGYLNERLIFGNQLSCLGVFVRNDVIKNNLFNENRDLIGSEDYELWLRLASRFKLYYSNRVTARLTQHINRSECNIDQKKFLKRIEQLISIVSTDSSTIRFLDKKFIYFKAHTYLFAAIQLALIRNKLKSLYFLIKAIRIDPTLIFHKKSLSIIYHLIKR